MGSHGCLRNISLKCIAPLSQLSPTCNLEVRVSVTRFDSLKPPESQQVEHQLNLVRSILASTPLIKVSPDWDFAIGTPALPNPSNRIILITHCGHWCRYVSVCACYSRASNRREKVKSSSRVKRV
jgi:hypothetical protein